MIGFSYHRYLPAASAERPSFAPAHHVCHGVTPERLRTLIDPEDTSSVLHTDRVSGGRPGVPGMARLLGIILTSKSKSSSGGNGQAADRFCAISLDIGRGLMFCFSRPLRKQWFSKVRDQLRLAKPHELQRHRRYRPTHVYLACIHLRRASSDDSND